MAYEGTRSQRIPSVTGDASDLDRASAVLNDLSAQMRAQTEALNGRRNAPPPSPTRGMTAALQGGTGQ